MSQREIQFLVEDMIEAIEKVFHYTLDMDEKGFLGDMKTQDAVLRNIQIIGEAANPVPRDFRDNSPEIEWSKIARSRHILVRDYFSTDLGIIWRIVKNNLPELRTNLSKVSFD
jgi:uncharacterized protein with HEPN domain